MRSLSLPPRCARPKPACLALLRVGVLALTLALGCAAVLPAPVRAAGQEPAGIGVERSVKAAFLYKFLGYVEFPAVSLGDVGTPFTVGVSGADDIAAELTRITAGRNVGSRGIVVRVVRDGDALAGLQMLFIGGGEAVRPLHLLHAAQQLGILTVTEADNGLQQGSVINFRLVEDRIRFEISLDAAGKSGLKLSSRLLAVAYHVSKEAP